MKKLYTLSLILLTVTLSFGQAFTATYDFAGVTNTSGLTDPSPVPAVTGLTFGSFSAIVDASATPPATNSTGGGRFSFTNQPLGATASDNTYANLVGSLDLGIYFEVTITPSTGITLDLTQITFKSQRSGTGIRTYAVRSSLDNYAANLSASVSPANAEISVEANNTFFRTKDATTSAQSGSTITLTNANALTSAVTFRFYGWNAEAAGGSFSIDDVVFTGSTGTLGTKQNSISGLNVYPNPVTNGNLFITSNSDQVKSVGIYDVIGKQVMKATVTNQPINVSNLNSGVYIIKISEDGKTATRKLVIK